MKKLDLATVNKRLNALGITAEKLLEKEIIESPYHHTFMEKVMHGPNRDFIAVVRNGDYYGYWLPYIIGEMVRGTLDDDADRYFRDMYYDRDQQIFDMGPEGNETHIKCLDYPVTLRYWDNQGNVEYVEVEG